ncbi:MAG: NHL domain-containing protein [Solirubrobacteraceae bacterium]
MFGDRRWRALAISVPVLALGISVGAVAAVSGPKIVRFAGDGRYCSTRQCGAGGPAAKAQLDFPSGVAVDLHGNVYIADGLNDTVWRVSPQGTISRFAGDGRLCLPGSACGNGGLARHAQLDTPLALAVDRRGDVYIADQAANQIRKVSADGRISRFAGSFARCTTAPRCGDGGRAVNARLNRPWGVAVDETGNVYIADYLDDEIRKVSPQGTISRFAGDGRHCTPQRGCGDGGPATSARLFMPAGVAVDRAGNVYIADSNDHAVRKVYPNGIVTRFAGTGQVCSTVRGCGDGGPAFLATMESPFGVAVDASGNVYVTDLERNDVRKIDARGTITTLAGSGRLCSTPGQCGDGLAAIDASLANPTGVAVDAAMNVYLADPGEREVRKLSGLP